MEFALSALTDDARHVELVTLAAFYHVGPVQQRLDVGHLVPVGAPWVPGSVLNHLLVSLPYPYGPEFEVCPGPNGHARILSLLPISAAERELAIAHGVDALEQRLDTARADFANPMRASTC